MRKEILWDLKDLSENHQIIKSDKWQSVQIDSANPIVSIFNVDNKIYISDDENLEESFNCDLEWAEEHFQERIGGLPINPGKAYKNWPYYNGQSDFLFRGEGQFSHNYMERIWCKGYKGIRFDYGDLNDIIKRINDDNNTRQAFLSIWHPEDQSNHGNRIPCTIGYWFFMEKGKLNIKFLIRSCDAIRHLRNDLYLSYRLLQHVAEKTGLQTGYLSYWIGSLHCFQTDLYSLNKIIKKWS